MTAKIHRGLRLVVALLLLVVGASLPSVAFAHMGAERAKLQPRAITPPKGPRGQVEIVSGKDGVLRLLRSEGSDYVGSFQVKNVGPGPLTISQVYAFDTSDAPRTARGFGVQPSGSERGALAPQQQRTYEVKWRADQSQASELYALLVVESDAAQPDATVVDPPKLVGVVAERKLGLPRYGTTAFVLSFVLLALASLGLRALRESVSKVLLGAIAIVPVALVVVMGLSFDSDFGARQGNDGLQFIERIVLQREGGLEYFVGLDGLSAPLLIVLALLSLVTVITASERDLRERPFAIVRFAALMSAIALALVSQTAWMFAAAFCAALAIAAWSLVGDGVALRRFIPFALASAICTLLSIRFLIAHAGTSYLFDGTPSTTVHAFGDIAATHLGADPSLWFGGLGYRVAWVLGVLGAVAILPHPFLAPALDAAMTRDRGLRARTITAPLIVLGGYVLMRTGLFLQPDGASFGAQVVSIVALGLATISALSSIAEADPRKALVRLAETGALLAVGAAMSLTLQGMQGALVLFGSTALSFLVAQRCLAVIEERAAPDEMASLGGLLRDAPILSIVYAIAIGTISLLPPLLGFWGTSLSAFGVIGRHPITGAWFLGITILTMIGGVRRLNALVGDPPKSWEKNKLLEPFGGRMPDLRGKEAWGLAFAAAILVLVGVYPRPWIRPSNATLLDMFPRLDPPGPTQVASDGDDVNRERLG